MATFNVRPYALKAALRQVLEQRAEVVARNPPPLSPEDERDLAAYLDIERQIGECQGGR